VTVGIALAPALAARDRQPIEFVEVQIVPLQALGVSEPTPPRAQPERREEPKAVVVTESSEAKKPTPAKRDPVAPTPPREQPRPSSESEGKSADGPAGAPAQRRGSPTGSAFATSPFGTAVAGFDNPDFVYGYYVEQMLAMIGSNWIRPQGAIDLEMTIHFRIHSSGDLSEVEVVESSGLSSFDLAGMRAVRLASPLPPLPRSFPHESLGVNLIIR
jgi:TonB family protein